MQHLRIQFLFWGLAFSLVCLSTTVRAENREDFYAKFDKVQIDIEKIVGCSKNELTLRLIEHPELNRIGVPLHGRKRLIMLTPEEDAMIGSETVRQLDNLHVFYRSEEDEKRVNTIAERITAVLPQHVKFECHLAATDEINAFCLIDGTLIVTCGALKTFSDRELAFIIAHEYGHALARHGAESLTKSIETEEIEVWVVGPKARKAGEETGKWKEKLIKGGYFLVAKLGVNLPYSRIMENEADALAIVFMKKAGYDPAGALEAMKHLQELSGQDAPNWKVFLSTHPSTKERYERLQTYAQYDEGSILSDAEEEESNVALDWAYDGVKMLDEIHFESITCEPPKGDVLFIPGIFMAKAENYLPQLSEVFPEYNISVLQWKAVSKLSWERSKYRAGMLSEYLSRMLSTKDQNSLENTILIGHSLGGKVVLGTLKGLASKDLKLKQVIMMGTAASYSADELRDCAKVGIEPTWNLFKPSDRILKYGFYYEEKLPALGLMGAKEAIPGILEYRIPGIEENETSEDKWKSHQAIAYFEGLVKIQKGELDNEKIKIDHHSIAAPKPLPKKLQTAIPESLGIVQDCLYDWQLISYKIPLGKFTKHLYVIRNPYGEACEWGFSEETVSKAFQDIKQKLQDACNHLD